MISDKVLLPVFCCQAEIPGGPLQDVLLSLERRNGVITHAEYHYYGLDVFPKSLFLVFVFLTPGDEREDEAGCCSATR